MSNDATSGEMMQCDRCGGDFKRLHVLDSVAHVDDQVCDDCVEPWDEVLEL